MGSGSAAAAGLPVLQVGPQAKFHTVQAAIDAAPQTGAEIRLAPGKYREKIHISTPNLYLVGTGKTPGDVVLSWDDSAKSAGGTGKSGSVTVEADGFEAENLTVENTWQNEHERTQEGSQAVALLLRSDRAVLDNVRLIGAQDTLYADSRTCHENLPSDGSAPKEPQPACRASREYFRDVYIEGDVDYIFGDAQAVFDRCELHPRHHPTVMFTAQSRHFLEEVSGYYFLHSSITGDRSTFDGSEKLVLGRPWRDYSTVWFYDTEIEPTITADGWSDWNGRLKTSEYREYKSHGPGVNGGQRIVSYPPLTKEVEKGLTPQALLRGTDGWNPVKAADRLWKAR
ncbi:pectinesterase family protein [Terriglobus aquaticus]